MALKVGSRVLDPLGVVQDFAECGVIVDLADRAAPFGTRLKRRLLPAVKSEGYRPGARVPVLVLMSTMPAVRNPYRRQGAGTGHGIGEAGPQRLAKSLMPSGRMTPLRRYCRLA